METRRRLRTYWRDELEGLKQYVDENWNERWSKELTVRTVQIISSD